MPTAENRDLDRLLDACQRLTDLQYRMARHLHAVGLVPEIIQLRLVAKADQIDALIDNARRTVAHRAHAVAASADPT